MGTRCQNKARKWLGRSEQLLELFGIEVEGLDIGCLDKMDVPEGWRCIEGPKWASWVCNKKDGDSCACCIKVENDEEDPEDPEEPEDDDDEGEEMPEMTPF